MIHNKEITNLPALNQRTREMRNKDKKPELSTFITAINISMVYTSGMDAELPIKFLGNGIKKIGQIQHLN